MKSAIQCLVLGVLLVGLPAEQRTPVVAMRISTGPDGQTRAKDRISLFIPLAEHAQPPSMTTSTAEQEVRAAEKLFNEARAKADIEALTRLLTDDWTITHGDGTIDTKAQYLADLKSGVRKFDFVNADQFSVRFHGDAAVAAGISDSKVLYKGQPSGGALRFTRVYVKQNGRWRMIVSHATRRTTIDAAAQQVEIAASIAFTEGPTVDKDGTVYFTDIVPQRIMKLSPDGALSTYRERSNVANGLLIDPEGRLIACEGGDFERGGVKLKGVGRVTRTDLRTGKIEVLVETYQGKPLQGPNDVTIDGKGRLYFTDMSGVAVYRIDGPGRIARILAAPDIQRPNGIQVSPDDRTLYLIEANGTQNGARMIRAYDLEPDGTVRNMRVHYNFYPGRSADGMSIDTRGNLYASAGLHQLRGTAETLDTKCGVYVVSPQGKLLKFIPIPEDTITNNAFGGPDMKTLYVTAGKTLYKIRTEIAGMPR